MYEISSDLSPTSTPSPDPSSTQTPPPNLQQPSSPTSTPSTPHSASPISHTSPRRTRSNGSKTKILFIDSSPGKAVSGISPNKSKPHGRENPPLPAAVPVRNSFSCLANLSN